MQVGADAKSASHWNILFSFSFSFACCCVSQIVNKTFIGYHDPLSDRVSLSWKYNASTTKSYSSRKPLPTKVYANMDKMLFHFFPIRKDKGCPYPHSYIPLLPGPQATNHKFFQDLGAFHIGYVPLSFLFIECPQKKKKIIGCPVISLRRESESGDLHAEFGYGTEDISAEING